MNKRLPEAQRLKLEARLQVLREVVATLEPGKAAAIVDKVGPDQSDIKGVVLSIMRLMDAEPGVAKYSTANKSIKYLLKQAFEMAGGDGPPAPPPEEELGAEDPGLGGGADPLDMVSDLSDEVQSMDDHRLVQEVKMLEQHMKEDLAKLPAFPGAEGLGADPSAGAGLPPAGPPPGAGAPPSFPPKASPALPPTAPPIEEEAPEEEEADAPFAEEAPEEETPFEEVAEEEPEDDSEPEESDESDDDSDEEPDEEPEEKKELKPEAKLALLMSLPKKQRLAKAAQLKALANVLEKDIREVSNDNEIVGNPNDELAHDYEGEEDGSMKDVKATNLQKTVRQLLAALESSSDGKKTAVKDKSTDKEAVLKLALRHLEASIEDMNEAKDEDSEHDNEEKKEASLDERKAILKARLESFKRTKTATVDGRSMSTPKEVPKPSGTSESELHGDAKIQYSTNNGADGTEVINDRRTPIKDTPQVAGTDEPNEIYFSNNPEKDRYKPTSESDSSKDKNNKRVLKDMGTAVQTSSPSSSTDNMEMGAGSHQKEKTWEKAKSESDITPTGGRLVGLAEMNEIIKTRTDRAVKLAGQMAGLGLIKTESQLGEKIAELASMDDSQFNVVASFLSTNLSQDSVRSTRPKKVAGEMPPWLDKGKKDDDDDSESSESDDEEHDKEDENDKHEASLVRRASQTAPNKTSRRAERGGLKTPLMSGTDAIINHRASASAFSRERSHIAEALTKVAWTDPEVEARKKADLDTFFSGAK